MAKRPSDTAVLAAKPPRGAPFSSHESRSVSVRQIDNGYVTCVSECTPQGEYKSREVFSQDRPEIGLQPGAGGSASLREAVQSIRK